MRPQAGEALAERPVALIVDKNPSVRASIRELLENSQISAIGAGSGPEALEKLHTQAIGIMVVDTESPGVAKVNLLEKVAQLRPSPLIVAIVGPDGSPPVKKLLDSGIYELFERPVDKEQGQRVVACLVRQLELQRELRELRRRLQAREGYHGIVGHSEAMEKLRREVEWLAGEELPVWITGEPGTGKELIASNIYGASARNGAPFVVVDCKEGSPENAGMSGAADLIEQAQGGILYLQGITALSQEAQEELLEKMQSIYSTEYPPVRIIASSTHSTQDALENGRLIDIIFAQQFDRPFLDRMSRLGDMIRLLAKTKLGQNHLRHLLPHKRAMLYFSQPSTRTFLSFQNACYMLGLSVSEIRGTTTSSEVKGESQEDTIRTFASPVSGSTISLKYSGLK